MAINNITFYYQNCRGIRTKLQTLYMNILSNSYDVIVLTETWLVPDIRDGEFIDDRYVVFRCDRDRIATKKKDGGGVLIAALRELRATILTTQLFNSPIEQILVQLPGVQQHTRHIIGVAYIPPASCAEVYEQYLDMLQGLANDPYCNSYHFFGDYNLPEIDWVQQGNHATARSTDSTGRILLNFINIINGLQFNYTKNSSGRVLDLIISNVDPQMVPCNNLVNPDTLHPPFSILTHLDVRFKPMKCHPVRRYNYYKANFDCINHDLGIVDWENSMSHHSSEMAVDFFYETIYRIVRSHVPLTYSKNTKFPIWFSPSLIKTFKSKEHAWIKWKKYGNHTDYVHFSNYRKLFHSETANCYKRYMTSVEDSIPKSIKYFWSYVSSKKGKAKYPANMFYENVSSDDPKEICNLFSTFFCSVYEPSTFNPDQWQPSNRYADNSPCISDIYLSKESIRLALRSLDSSKGAGPDGIPPSFFIRTSDHLSTALHIIFNKCLKEGVFPKVWKQASITPVYKTGDKNNVENYRPISILSTLSRVFERLVHGALYPHIRHLILPEQHGFVKRRSTTTNLMTFVNYLFENMDRRVQVDAVYTDFQRAFDKVDHTLLMEKIAFNGIRGNLLRWFASYIFNRTQKIFINGHESDSIVVTSGVPQGSVLGPFLFVLFINDIKHCFVNSNFLMYADDMKIYITCKNIHDCYKLQQDLDRFYEYCLKNKLFLSLPKCYTISFTKNKNQIKFNYSINNVNLNEVQSVRDLGVTLDSRLHFDIHIDNIVKKAFQMYGLVMRFSSSFVRPSTFLILYKTLIRSQLEYAVQIWDPLYDKYKDRLEIVQKKYLRTVNYKCYRPKVSYEHLLKRYHVLSLESRRLLLGVMMLHGICNNRFDCIPLSNSLHYIVPRSVMHRGVRVPRLFHANSCKSNAGVRVPLRRLVEAYNSHFMELDIFTHSKNRFRARVIELLNS